jgi:hypothetical protein
MPLKQEQGPGRVSLPLRCYRSQALTSLSNARNVALSGLARLYGRFHSALVTRCEKSVKMALVARFGHVGLLLR